MTGNQRHGWAVFAAMTILFLGGFFVSYYFEARGNPNFDQYGVKQAAIETSGAEQAGGNMEGKEVRFGIANSALLRRSPPMLRVARSTRCTTLTLRSAE